MPFEKISESIKGLLKINSESILWNYFDSFLILIIFYLFSQLAVFILQKIILKLASKTKTDVDDLIIKKTSKPISIILLAIGIRLALLPINLNKAVLDTLENIVGSIVIIIVTYIIIVVLDIIIENWGKRIAQKTKSTFDDELIPIIHRFSKVFFSLVGLLFVLPVWGIQIGPLLASLGIAGIAVAFALQSTLSNIFGGVALILDKSIKVGDKIKLDNDTMGTVLDVGLRSTKVKTWDNEVITLPNGKLADSKILNFIQPDPSVRIVIFFGVEYGSDTKKVKDIVLKVIDSTPEALKEPAPKVQMIEMADFSLKFRVLFWVKNFDIKFDTKAAVTEKLYNSLRDSGVGIPFPTRTVYMKKE